MYKIILDKNLLFYTGSEELLLRIANLTMELNRFGNFSFKIGSENQNYKKIKKKKSIICIYEDGKRVFRGRVLDSKKNFYNEYHVICEGELGFLKDSILRPYEFKGSVVDYFTMLINQHNNQVDDEARRFKVGRVTVIDPNDYIIRSNQNYPDTWTEIEEKLLKNLGGYILTREGTDGYSYIDYLKDSETINQQEIRYAENLLDNGFEEALFGKDVVTCIIPLGSKVKDEEGNDTDIRVGIESVNNGRDFVEEPAAVERYGRIYKTITWDDVNLPEILLEKARKALQDNINLKQTITLSAVDLHALNMNIQGFRLFNYTKVISEPHNISAMFLVRKISIDLLDPSCGILTLGSSIKTFIDKNIEDTSNLNGIITEHNKQVNTEVALLKKNMSSQMKQEADQIYMQVKKEVYEKGEVDRLVIDVNTRLTQTEDSFSFEFRNFQSAVDQLEGSTDARFQDINKYIRFIDGVICIGIEGNPIVLKMANDRISFTENGAEVAYISNRRMYVTEVEAIKSLILGNFAFIPRKNGNLSFKKIR